MKSNYSMIFQRIIDSPYYNFRENTYLIMHTRSVEKHYKTRSRKKKKKNREINFLVTSLVKALISRKKF